MNLIKITAIVAITSTCEDQTVLVLVIEIVNMTKVKIFNCNNHNNDGRNGNYIGNDKTYDVILINRIALFHYIFGCRSHVSVQMHNISKSKSSQMMPTFLYQLIIFIVLNVTYIQICPM